MLALVLSLLLATIAVIAFPCWRHSARWGHMPSVAAATLLLLVALAAAGGKPRVTDALAQKPPPPRISAEEVRMANLPRDETLQAF